MYDVDMTSLCAEVVYNKLKMLSLKSYEELNGKLCRVSDQCSDGRCIRTPDLHSRRRHGHQFYTRTKLMVS